MIPVTRNLIAELDVLSRELDEAQRMIDHARKTRFAQHLPFVRSYLDRRQLELDTQRIRVEAGKTYMGIYN